MEGLLTSCCDKPVRRRQYMEDMELDITSFICSKCGTYITYRTGKDVWLDSLIKDLYREELCQLLRETPGVTLKKTPNLLHRSLEKLISFMRGVM